MGFTSTSADTRMHGLKNKMKNILVYGFVGLHILAVFLVKAPLDLVKRLKTNIR